MTKSLLAAALAAALLPAAAQAAGGYSFTHAWTYDHALSGVAGLTSEIPAFDASTGTLWLAGVSGVDILNMSGARVGFIDTTPFGSINSVAIRNGVAAFAIESATRTDPGTVAFYDTATRALTGSVAVGALPDMLTFTPDGSRLLVANEATPTTYGGLDPAGSVSIIDMGTRSVLATAGFAGVPVSGSALRTQATVGMDFEPEYIAVNAAGTKAFVTLQEANGIGVLDLASNSFTSVVGLGTKNFNTAANAIDPNHKDSAIALRPSAVSGLYQPDGIAAYQAGGQTYLVMANEGDTREDDGDKARAKDTALTGYPADLKQLNISTVDSSNGNLVTFGGRSFSIRDAAGNLVFDSGNDLDARAIAAGIYDDNRSDDKGVEPEGVALFTLGGRTLAFIGLERTTKGAVAVYDVTDPNAVSFVDFIVTNGDLAPEGLQAFMWNGTAYLAIANEVSNTTSVYAMAPVPEPQTYALLLAGLGLLGGAVRRRRAQAAE
jgi:DNA-binding beta-propeller fold protein YncE